MNRTAAREIAETITPQQIKQMFDKAKENITDWRKVSVVNKGMSKGAAWNILAKDFDIEDEHHMIRKTNMVREFGEFLPDELKPKPKLTLLSIIIHHDPIF